MDGIKDYDQQIERMYHPENFERTNDGDKEEAEFEDF